ncbi:MAG: Sir2 family NAD-dependent protein deacetylase [Planctomycetota bacterium]|nr:Sir2 family NAD-dependent protein deacetylase [Planctomycetota bacterium]
MPDPDLLRMLRACDRILVFTGAGISTGSGIPDFRGPNGVWKKRQPVYYRDFMSSPEARLEYWDQKLEGFEAFANARPNATHEAVAALERAGKLLCCVTQNIDGLHGKAGTSRGKLIEVHGTMAEIECQGCKRRGEPAPAFAAFAKTRTPPTCEACGGWLKPATISFGQSLRQADLEAAFGFAERCDLVVALGSTLSVHPAASIPLAAAERGAGYVVVNRGPTDHDRLPCVTLRLEGDVAEIFAPAVKGLE